MVQAIDVDFNFIIEQPEKFCSLAKKSSLRGAFFNE